MRVMSTHAASWSKERPTGPASLGSLCHAPDTVVARRRKRPDECWYCVMNCATEDRGDEMSLSQGRAALRDQRVERRAVS
jgi:hypothetical protein